MGGIGDGGSVNRCEDGGGHIGAVGNGGSGDGNGEAGAGIGVFFGAGGGYAPPAARAKYWALAIGMALPLGVSQVRLLDTR